MSHLENNCCSFVKPISQLPYVLVLISAHFSFVSKIADVRYQLSVRYALFLNKLLKFWPILTEQLSLTQELNMRKSYVLVSGLTKKSIAMEGRSDRVTQWWMRRSEFCVMTTTRKWLSAILRVKKGVLIFIRITYQFYIKDCALTTFPPSFEA